MRTTDETILETLKSASFWGLRLLAIYMAAMAISMGENDESAVVLDTWTYRASTSENTLMGSKMWKKKWVF